MSLQVELASLFERDLRRLQDQINAFRSEDHLWSVAPGINNSTGNLTLHIEGNLAEYIGRQLGERSYTRNRPNEFSARGNTKEDLLNRVSYLLELIPPIIRSLSSLQMEAQYPEVVLQEPMSTRQFLVHLYAHLSWHLGQIDYLRRILIHDQDAETASYAR